MLISLGAKEYQNGLSVLRHGAWMTLLELMLGHVRREDDVGLKVLKQRKKQKCHLWNHFAPITPHFLIHCSALKQSSKSSLCKLQFFWVIIRMDLRIAEITSDLAFPISPNNINSKQITVTKAIRVTKSMPTSEYTKSII